MRTAFPKFLVLCVSGQPGTEKYTDVFNGLSLLWNIINTRRLLQAEHFYTDLSSALHGPHAEMYLLWLTGHSRPKPAPNLKALPQTEEEEAALNPGHK